ncbi:protoporphyrinogen oxidase [Marinilabiliaceae bacterium ANBcel2]|nr:protoporphyrinogen oxidase [Marinilabiliaceae bacterium ANBcel2]
MSNKNGSVIITGAGLTGLTTAFYLKKAGINFTIIEKKGRPGGSIKTYKEKGFIFESGPNTGVVSHAEVQDLFDNLKGEVEFEPANKKAKRRLIWKGARWHDLPGCIKDGVKTPLFAWKDKFKLLLEPFRKKGSNPNETLEALVKRRMGASFLNYAVDPFVIGIYAGDPSKLITRHALPKLYQLEQNYGSFIKGGIKKAFKKKDENERKATRTMFSVKGGLNNLINALVKFIGEENIIYNCENLTIYPENRDYSASFSSNGEEKKLFAKYVISTTGAHEIPNTFPFLNQKEKNDITNLTYAKVLQVAVGYKNWRGLPLKAFGGLIPHKEKRNILGIQFLSSFLSGRAPEDGALLSVFLGGVRNPEITEKDDNTIKEIVMQELKCMLLIPEGDEPDLFKVFKHTHAIPQYSITTEQRLKRVKKIEKQFPGLFLAGNLRDGIGMADRIRQGTIIAKKITG